MDLLINPTLENSLRISNSFTGLKMNGFVPDTFAKLGLQISLKKIYYAELITPQKDGLTFFEVVNDAIEAVVFNMPIKLASVATLIQQK